MINNKKRVTYNNNVRKRLCPKPGQVSQTVAKFVLTTGKVMLSNIFLKTGKLVHHDFLRSITNDTEEGHSKNKKRTELINRKDVRPHIFLVTLQKFRKLGWEVLMDPLYSPSD